MRIIEQFIQGKKDNPSLCEDGLLITDNLVILVDGVTSKGSHVWKNGTSGTVAKEAILDYFLANENAAYLSADNLFQKLSDVLKSIVLLENISCDLEDIPRATIILYNEIYHEVWSYGDCQCIVNNTWYKNSKLIDEKNAEIRSEVLHKALNDGELVQNLLKDDIGREVIKEQLRSQFYYENTEDVLGYPVLNGEKICINLIKKWHPERGSEVVLATDGYPILKDTLQKSEKCLENLLSEDPLCIDQYISTKGMQEGQVSFDDRTYCRFVTD